jgi:hypothetical protein
MERGMRRLAESTVHRVAIIAGATAIFLIAVLVAKPFYSATTGSKAPNSADESRPAANQEPALERASFVTSPTMESNPKFFFGSGDGGNGYYAEQPQRTRQ